MVAAVRPRILDHSDGAAVEAAPAAAAADLDFD